MGPEERPGSSVGSEESTDPLQRKLTKDGDCTYTEGTIVDCEAGKSLLLSANDGTDACMVGKR